MSVRRPSSLASARRRRSTPEGDRYSRRSKPTNSEGDYLALRRAIARVYRQHLPPEVREPHAAKGAEHSYHQFVIVSSQRDAIIRRLDEEGIGYGIHYPTPIHLMRGYEFLGYNPGTLPVTERAAREVLSLPCYPELPLKAVRRVCSAVNDVARSKS